MRRIIRSPDGGQAADEINDAEVSAEVEVKPIEIKRASPKSAPAETHVDTGPVEQEAAAGGMQDAEYEAARLADEAMRAMGEEAPEQTEQKKAFAGDTSAWQVRTAAAHRPWQTPEGKRDNLPGLKIAFESLILSLLAGAAVGVGLSLAGMLTIAAVTFGLVAIPVTFIAYMLARWGSR